MAKGNAPEIVNIIDLGNGDNGVLQLSLDALSKVLCQPAIKDKPLAVIGIAGALRTGKSFLLTFLIRYLKNHGWNNPTWIGGDEKCADDGIEWKRGSKAHTKGIIIWNEIFTIEKENGDELAVLLLDTQGLFDDSMSREENMKIFTFTVLMTSHLLLNITSKIDERELESLEFFTQYAKAASVGSEDDFPFQNLIFMIRDWPYPDENPFGFEGGKAYLTEKLEQKLPRQELNVVRQNLRSTFQNLKGFLMPHPGHKVSDQDFKGKNKDINPEFLTSVEQLAITLFDPKNLNYKSFNNKNLTGRELWSLLQSCNETFVNGQVPKVENMVVAFAKMRNKIAVSEAFKIFEDTYKKEETKNANNRGKKRDSFYKKAQEAALQYFEAQTNFGGEDIRVQYRQNLISECQQQFHTYANWDDLRKVRAQNVSLQIRHEVWTKYRENMKKDLGGDHHKVEDFDKIHKKNEGNARKSYQVKTAKCASFHEEDEALLIEDIQHSYEKFLQVNYDLERIVLLGGLQLQGIPKSEDQKDLERQYEATLVLHQLSEQYREEFEKFYVLYLNEEDLKQQINKLKESYLKLFENTWTEEGANIDCYREKFLNLLFKEEEDCLNMNLRNKNVFEKTIEESIIKVKACYHETMHGITKEAYCDPEVMERVHRETKKKLTENLRKELSGIDDKKQNEMTINKAQREMDEKFEDFRQTNERNFQKKPKFEWDTVGEKIAFAMEMFGVAMLFIRKVCAVVSNVKTTHNTIKNACRATVGIISSAEALVPSVSSLAVGGAAAAAVGLGVVAYCVYKHYDEKAVKEKPKIKQ